MAFVEFAVFFLTRKYTHPKHFELTYLRGPTESFEITRLNPEINSLLSTQCNELEFMASMSSVAELMYKCMLIWPITQNAT